MVPLLRSALGSVGFLPGLAAFALPLPALAAPCSLAAPAAFAVALPAGPLLAGEAAAARPTPVPAAAGTSAAAGGGLGEAAP